jgi:hypothetical protein
MAGILPAGNENTGVIWVRSLFYDDNNRGLKIDYDYVRNT